MGVERGIPATVNTTRRVRVVATASLYVARGVVLQANREVFSNCVGMRGHAAL